MKESLISEPIRPAFSTAEGHPDAVAGDSHPAAGAFQAVGEPLLPSSFVWRGEEQTIAVVIERWKELSHAGASMQERYVRKHWYRIRTGAGLEMKIYFERQARSKGGAKQRWWLYSVLRSE